MRISDWSSDVCSSDLAITFCTPLVTIFSPGRSPSRTTHLSPCISPSLIERGTAWPFLSTTKTEAPESAIFTAICGMRSEEHTSELQSLMRISYAVFCLKKKKKHHNYTNKDTLQTTQ